MDFNFNIDWIAAIPEIYILSIINFLIVYAVIYSTLTKSRVSYFD